MSDGIKQVRIQFVADTSKLKEGANKAKESMKSVKDAMTDGQSKWQGFSKKIGKISGSLGKVSSGIGETIGTISEVFTKVTKSTKSVKLAILAVLAVIAIKVAKVAWQIASATAKAFDNQAYNKAMNERTQGLKKLKTAVGAFTSPIVNAINGFIGWLLSGLAKVVQGIHSGLAFIWGFFTGLLQPAMDAIGKAIDAVKDAIGRVVEAIKGGINAIAGFLGFGDVFKKAEEGAKETAESVEEVGEQSEYATGALQGFDKLNTMDAGEGDAQTSAEITATSNAMQALGKTMSKGLSDWIGKIPEMLGNVWEGIKEKGRQVLQWIANLPTKIKEMAIKAWQAFVNIFKGIGTWIKDKLKALLDFDWMGLWNKFCEVMGGVGTWIWDKLTGILDFDWTELWNKFCKAMGDAGQWIWDKLTGVLDFDFGQLWTQFTTAMSDVKQWLLDELDKVLDFDWTGLWNGFCEAMGGLVTWLKDKIVAGVKAALDVVGNIWGGITDFVGGIGDSIGGAISGETGLFHGASGAVIDPNNPFPIVVGDNTKEPEVLSPVSTMKQAFKEALAESGMLKQATQSQASGTIVLQVDGKTLARATYDDLIAEGNRRGRRTIA